MFFNWQVSVPSEALQSSWTEDCRNIWGLKLRNSSSTEDLLQVLISLYIYLFVQFYMSSWYLDMNSCQGRHFPPFSFFFQTGTSYLFCSIFCLHLNFEKYQFPWALKMTDALNWRYLKLLESITATWRYNRQFLMKCFPYRNVRRNIWPNCGLVVVVLTHLTYITCQIYEIYVFYTDFDQFTVTALTVLQHEFLIDLYCLESTNSYIVRLMQAWNLI